MDADSIAAGIVAEAVQRGRLALPAVEARLGPTVARLLADILEVRHAMRADARGQQLHCKSRWWSGSGQLMVC